jgi:hypothetical protein
MTTTDTVLLVILTSLMSLFFLLGIVSLVMVVRILSSVKRVLIRAESVVDSVEAAADVLKDAGGKLAVFKLIKNIIDMAQHKK